MNIKAIWLFIIFESDQPFVTLYGLETITRKSQARLLNISKYTLSPVALNVSSPLFTRNEKRMETFKNNKSPKKNRILTKAKSKFSYKISEIQASFKAKAGLEDA